MRLANYRCFTQKIGFVTHDGVLLIVGLNPPDPLRRGAYSSGESAVSRRAPKTQCVPSP